jgi:hypothetical protein
MPDASPFVLDAASKATLCALRHNLPQKLTRKLYHGDVIGYLCLPMALITSHLARLGALS